MKPAYPAGLTLALLCAASSCSERFPDLSASARAGWEVYRVHCLLCHTDPLRESPTGPALAGASLALLRAKVLEARYPDGYAPKRPGAITMPKVPAVRDDLEAIAAFLAEVK